MSNDNYTIVLDGGTNKYVVAPILREQLSLGDLKDVEAASSLEDKFVLIYNGTSQKWEMRAFLVDDIDEIDGGVY